MVATHLSAAVFGLLATGTTGARTTSHSEAYDEFRQTYRSQQRDAVSVAERAVLFHSRKAEIETHNANGKSWTEGVNKFTDYTHAEKQQLLGYRRSGHAQGEKAASSFLESTKMVRKEKLADAMDWGSQGLESGEFHRNQGACGSCWAVAAFGAIEMHAELQHPGNATRFSAEQMIDCTPNPQHCGGTGGCHGATAELAFEYIKSGRGIALNTDYPIDNKDDHCTDSEATMSARVDNWIRLPENELDPLLETIATKGPAVVSLDASQWFAYSGGVFEGCSEDAIVNHAVLLTGYGVDEETGQKYWRIRNSWGKEWGEEGHIRLLRHDNAGDYCGVDSKPEDGVGCDGGPETLPVCGMCGILSDTSYPSEVSFISA